MKRLLGLPLAILLVLGLTIPVFGATPKIADCADLLTAEEESRLEAKAQALADDYGMDTVILTVDSLEGQDPESYADDYYDQNGYGCGAENSGVLLLLAMDTRDWAISTCGDGIYALTDYGMELLFSEIAPELGTGNYCEAFSQYLSELETYYREFTRGAPIDGETFPYEGPGSYESGSREETVSYAPQKDSPSLSLRILLSLLVGAAVGGVAIWVMRSGMNTGKAHSGATDYMTPGSFHFTNRQDILLHSRTTRTQRTENTASHSGGSSVHHSSGGVRHGGSHGKF